MRNSNSSYLIKVIILALISFLGIGFGRHDQDPTFTVCGCLFFILTCILLGIYSAKESTGNPLDKNYFKQNSVVEILFRVSLPEEKNVVKQHIYTIRLQDGEITTMRQKENLDIGAMYILKGQTWLVFMKNHS